METVTEPPKTQTNQTGPLPSDLKAKSLFAQTIREGQAASAAKPPQTDGTTLLTKDVADHPGAGAMTDEQIKKAAEAQAAAKKEKEGIEIPSAIKSEKAAESFRKINAEKDKAISERDEIKAKHEAAEKKALEIETKLRQLESAKTPDAKAIEEATRKLEENNKRLQEYEKIVSQFYVEHDPQFQQVFGGRIDSAIGDAKAVVGDKAESVEAILRGPQGRARDAALKEIATDLDDFDRTRLVQAYDRLVQAERDKAHELAKSRENYSALQKMNQEKAQVDQAKLQEQKKGFQAAILAEAAKIEKAFEGDDDKEAAAYREDLVKKYSAEDYPLTETVKLPAQAAEATRLKTKVIPSLLEQIKERDAQIAELQAANPNVNPRGDGKRVTQSGNFNTSDKPGKSKFMEMMGN